MTSTNPPRIVLVGTGTGVGKTWIGCELVRLLRADGRDAVGLKPIESGVTNPDTTDGALLAQASSERAEDARALEAAAPFRFPDPISPHLAAERVGRSVSIETVLAYIREQESLLGASRPLGASVIETAGGLFSPLASGVTNWDLARALEPAKWLLVAADALGVLHDTTATLLAARALGREPDAIVLSRSRPADASTGTNAREIERLGIAPRPVVMPADGAEGLRHLIRALLPSAPRIR